MIRTFYFVGGAIGAIALSNFLGTVARAFPQVRAGVAIIITVLILSGLVAAWTAEFPDEAFPIWFIGVAAIAMGVSIAFI